MRAKVLSDPQNQRLSKNNEDLSLRCCKMFFELTDYNIKASVKVFLLAIVSVLVKVLVI